MGYLIPVFKEFVSRYDSEVHVIHWDHKRQTPFVTPNIEGVNFYRRVDFSSKELQDFVFSINPDIIYISGWMDIGYLSAVRQMRKKGVPVVAGFDDIWFKTYRQRIASVIFPVFKTFFYSHAWVAGPYQYEFAKRLGFRNAEIIFNCLSADNNLFSIVYENSIIEKKDIYPHKFLFSGRFEKEKGIDLLVTAWNNINRNNLHKDWTLTLIGNGSLVEYLSSFSTINYIDFLQPQDLANEIKKYGCFILPSRFEPWALVLHEYAVAGFPIICSDTCGASPVFVTAGYNGYTFKTGNIEDLEKQMLKIINSSDQELIVMSEKSHQMGNKITPEISAASFMSILDH